MKELVKKCFDGNHKLRDIYTGDPTIITGYSDGIFSWITVVVWCVKCGAQRVERRRIGENGEVQKTEADKFEYTYLAHGLRDVK